MKLHQRHDNGLRARQALSEAINWRCQSLIDAGFSDVLAASVAIDPCLDLHAVLQLVDRGCPPDVAISLLEPWPNEMRS